MSTARKGRNTRNSTHKVLTPPDRVWSRNKSLRIWTRIMIQMNRKKNHSIDQKISMNETSATIMASSLSVVFCDQGNGHYIPRAVAFWAGSPRAPVLGLLWHGSD